MIYYCKHRS